MPSNDPLADALQAIQPGIAAFHAAVAAAGDRVDAYLTSIADEPAHDGARARLGEFACDRIDVERFAALWSTEPVLDEFERGLLQDARDILREYAALPDSRFVVDVRPGGRLTASLAIAFADLGRPFGAALAAELTRTGRYDAAEHATLLHALPRQRWNRGERATSPPLVVSVDGADLWAGEVAQYLDGNQKIVLVVRPPVPPAALVRLITPATLVAQTSNPETLAFTMRTSGPAVVAFLPEGSAAAEFMHLPDGHRPVHERLTVSSTPQGSRKAIETWTTWQQDQELQQLLALATPPAARLGAANDAAAAVDPADRLAAWLLANANLAS